MGWCLGIDEAGYGPNLGPFVMSAVACHFEDDPPADLWQALNGVVRRGRASKKDTRLHIDDSKRVHNPARGLFGLERAVFAVFGLPGGLTLADLVTRLCPDDAEELSCELWHRGDALLPGDVDFADLETQQAHFAAAGLDAKLTGWIARSVVICPRRFNRLTRAADSKGAVLSYAFIRLLSSMLELTGGGETVSVYADKQGGRNTYAAQIQQATGGMVVALEETAERSAYRVACSGRPIEVCFQPRADSEQFCVALASMVSKYLRELFMGEFNRFWQGHVPGLAPTAGYPGDSPRYYEAIRPAVERLQIAEDDVWRHR